MRDANIFNFKRALPRMVSASERFHTRVKFTDTITFYAELVTP